MAAIGLWLIGCTGESTTEVEETVVYLLSSSSTVAPAVGYSSSFVPFAGSSGTVLQSSGDFQIHDLDDSKDDSKDDSMQPSKPAAPALLPPAGFYTSVDIPVPTPTQGGVVRCTFDGSEPTTATAQMSSPKTVSATMAVRCTEFVGDVAVLRETQTYFIREFVQMPVVAISVDPAFFDKIIAGRPCKPDPCKSAAFWDDVESPVHVEYFAEGNNSKEKAFEIDAGISIMGGWSRNQLKKSVSICMRKEYQDGRLKYPLFTTRPEKKKFKAFNLRNNGNRFVSDYIEDPMAVSLLEGTDVDYQRSRQVVVYYNGRYYGIHDMREKLNEHFVETNYGIDSKLVDVIKHTNKDIKASGGSADSYINMLNFVAANDFSGNNNTAFTQLWSMLDIYSYADYMAAEIYYHNGDWPNNNVRAWHTSTQPWKMMAFDIDHGFDWMWGAGDFNQSTDMFDWILQGGDGSCTNSSDPMCFHNIFVKLIQNPDFMRIFLHRSSIMFNSYVNSARVAAAVDAMTATLSIQDISMDMAKFPREEMWYRNECGGGFEYDGACIKDWASRRDSFVKSEYKYFFKIDKEINVSFMAQGSGFIQVEGFRLPDVNYNGKFFEGVPMLLKAENGTGTFVGWEDGSMDNPRAVVPTEGAVYTAIFK